MSDPIIKVKDVMFPRFTAPDLDAAETFLTDFGMERSARTDTALYMRGVDGDHHVHVTELGDPGFMGEAGADDGQVYPLLDQLALSIADIASGVDLVAVQQPLGLADESFVSVDQ